MNMKSGLQLLNLGLSIFNKVQTMQHRQIRMANELSRNHLARGRRNTQIRVTDDTVTTVEESNQQSSEHESQN